MPKCSTGELFARAALVHHDDKCYLLATCVLKGLMLYIEMFLNSVNIIYIIHVILSQHFYVILRSIFLIPKRFSNVQGTFVQYKIMSSC